jgi:hypothetical protein
MIWGGTMPDEQNGMRCRGAGRSNEQSGPLPNSLPFEDRRQALAYADAERRDAARGAGASHLVDQCRGEAALPLQHAGSPNAKITYRCGDYQGSKIEPFSSLSSLTGRVKGAFFALARR